MGTHKRYNILNSPNYGANNEHFFDLDTPVSPKAIFLGSSSTT